MNVRTHAFVGGRLRANPMMVLTLTVALVASVFGLGLPVAAQDEAPPEPVVIEDGNVRLGVRPEGHLNISCEAEECPVGLQYVPTGNEATAPGCLCEGWGVASADADRMVSGFANEDTDGGANNLEVLDFDATATQAVSTVLVREGDGGEIFEVTHDFHLSGSDDLYEVTVEITNVSDTDVSDLRYRRVMDWDIEPTPFAEFVTIQGDAADLLFSSNGGFSSADPLAERQGDVVGPPEQPAFEDSGPADHGALFDFGFGALAAGESRRFNIYYGAAGTENEALLAVDFVGATLYSLGQPSTEGGATEGTPNTFIFGFGSVGGESLERLAIRKRADTPTTPAGGTNGYTLYLTNPNEGPADMMSVVDTLPQGFSYIDGSSALDGSAIADPSASVDASTGRQLLTWSGPFPIAPKSQRLLTFDVVIAGGQEPGRYLNNASGEAVSRAEGRDGDPIAVRSSGDAAPITVPHPTVATGATATSTTGSITIDPSTGAFTAAMPFGGRSDVTVSADVTCPDGSTPASVALQHGGIDYPMVEDTASSGTYTATIPAAAVVDGPVVVAATCGDTVIPNEVGRIVLYDPSGVVTDARTGAPVVGATVTLFKIPFAQPDTATQTLDCRTVDTRSGDTWSDEPAADPSSGVEVDESIQPAEIDPTINPQITNVEGRYGWDVAIGCYYVIVTAEGYRTLTSALVGVPPEVTDLDLQLTPATTSGGGGGGGGAGPGTPGPGEEPEVPAEGSLLTISPATDSSGNSDVAIEFSQLAYPDGFLSFAQAAADEVLLASEEVFADALASGSLQSDRPLLLNASGGLEAAVLAEIERLGASTVRILGGTAAVSQTVEDELLAEGLDVVRTFGPTRLETAGAIAGLVDADEAFLARAFAAADAADETQAFADSLALGGWAAASGSPVLLSQSEGLSKTTSEILTESAVTRLRLVGGEAALSASVHGSATALVAQVDRVAGPNRFATAVALAQARGFGADAPAEAIVVIEGQGSNSWGAGFAAAALSAMEDAPIVLVNGDEIPTETTAFLDAATAGSATRVVCAASQVACDAVAARLGIG